MNQYDCFLHLLTKWLYIDGVCGHVHCYLKPKLLLLTSQVTNRMNWKYICDIKTGNRIIMRTVKESFVACANLARLYLGLP